MFYICDDGSMVNLNQVEIIYIKSGNIIFRMASGDDHMVLIGDDKAAQKEMKRIRSGSVNGNELAF